MITHFKETHTYRQINSTKSDTVTNNNSKEKKNEHNYFFSVLNLFIQHYILNKNSLHFAAIYDWHVINHLYTLCGSRKKSLE